VVDLGSTKEDDLAEISQRARNLRSVVNARLWQINHNRVMEAEVGIFLVAARWVFLSRSDLKTRVEALE